MTKLPIDEVIPELKTALREQSNAVLIAPPGAGKTTRVPLALLEEEWLAGRRILMLEPRRMAARSAAGYMAKLLGQQVGEKVGYRVRRDSKVGSKTRIEVITEGVLTRILQNDQELEGVGAVIFDEFHERSLHADLGLALCLQSQMVLRPDLRIIVMSATLEAQPVASILNTTKTIVSEGKAFPVKTFYLERSIEGRIEPAVVNTILAALEEQTGDILVFLPGAGEIRRVEARLIEAGLGPNISVVPLYGTLPQSMQDRAIAPSRSSERKVVLATSIAETSITVDGVKVVIDSGLARIPRFSPRTGMTALDTVQVSKASADQRRGRAGRLEPGVCYRLWTKQQDLRLEPRSIPEILEADLTPLALELAVWGVSDKSDLLWLDLPPEAAFCQARELLYQLGALDEKGVITPHGKQMAESGLNPRLAHMVLRAKPMGLGGLACELAAILSERDIFQGRSNMPTDADLRLRIELLRGGSVDWSRKGDLQRIEREIIYLKQAFAISSQRENIDKSGLLLAFAYPDRIAQRRSVGRFLMRSGRGAAFIQMQPLSETDYLVAAEVDDKGAEGKIFLAAPIEAAEIKEHFAEQIEEQPLIAWDSNLQAVRARKIERLGALILKETPMTNANQEQVLSALLQGIIQEGIAMLPWTRQARRLQERLVFMHSIETLWPDMSNERLTADLGDWLAPYLYGLTSRQDIQRLNLVDIFLAMLSWEQRQLLDEYVPTHITVPSGQRIAVDYSNPADPVLAVRLQEMFGLLETPRIAGGRVTLTLQLLSPAQRPVQVTRDLASFWDNTYFEVRKDLQGRYPKHYWPEDPLNAIPTHRVRPRA